MIAGPTTSGSDAGNLLLVRREMGVPGTEGGSAVWSLDHLFLDADGVPVVVEVKRSTDTRIRREVVGQLLDYAANGVKYWPLDSLREAVEARASRQGVTGDDLVAALRPGLDPEAFWRAVGDNLSSGRIRMLFVADRLPAELVRIIEFLNEQMSPAEVLGVELRQYVGEGTVAYVPHVIGRTSEAAAKKNQQAGQVWTRETFLAAAHERRPAPQVALVERLLADLDTHGGRPGWGRGVTPGVSGWYPVDGEQVPVWNLNVNAASLTARAYLYFYLGDLAKRVPPERIDAAAAVLESVPALKAKIAEARASGWNKYPSVYLADVAESPDAVAALFQAVRTISGAPYATMPR